jgi:hypothetical protein
VTEQTKTTEREQLAADIREALVGKTKRDEQVAAMVELIEGLDRVDFVWGVYPDRTRVEVERAEAYGLTFGLDANGEACRVNFPYGAFIDE